MPDEPGSVGADAAVKPLAERPPSRHQERILELVATIILAMATVGTA
jgi:hypothetical protein